jgi:hypothetical protein
MAWWLIPIVATLSAIAWVTWRARPRRPADPHDSLAAHRRFTEAMSHPAPTAKVIDDTAPGVAHPDRRSA